METKLQIQHAINLLNEEPKALNSRIDPEQIIVWLSWIIRFIDLYNKVFKNKKGEYRKPLGRAWAIVGAVFALGMELIKIKK